YIALESCGEAPGRIREGQVREQRYGQLARRKGDRDRNRLVPKDPFPLRENGRERKRGQEQTDMAAGAPLPNEHAERDRDEREREVDNGAVFEDLRLVDRAEGERHPSAQRSAGCPYE